MRAVYRKTRRMHGRVRVLVADDERTIRESISQLLQTRGYTVDAVASAQEALAAAGARTPDVAIVDWKMPGSGAAVVEGLLASDTFEGRIYLLTGQLAPEVGAYTAAGVKLISKPFSYWKLLDLLEAKAQPAATFMPEDSPSGQSPRTASTRRGAP